MLFPMDGTKKKNEEKISTASVAAVTTPTTTKISRNRRRRLRRRSNPGASSSHLLPTTNINNNDGGGDDEEGISAVSNPRGDGTMMLACHSCKNKEHRAKDCQALTDRLTWNKSNKRNNCNNKNKNNKNRDDVEKTAATTTMKSSSSSSLPLPLSSTPPPPTIPSMSSSSTIIEQILVDRIKNGCQLHYLTPYSTSWYIIAREWMPSSSSSSSNNSNTNCTVSFDSEWNSHPTTRHTIKVVNNRTLVYLEKGLLFSGWYFVVTRQKSTVWTTVKSNHTVCVTLVSSTV